MKDASAIEAALLELVAARGADRSICPSEVARAVTADGPPEAWRGQLGAVRQVAQRLAAAGRIEILRKGKAVPPEAMRGVIRLRLRPDGDGVAG